MVATNKNRLLKELNEELQMLINQKEHFDQKMRAKIQMKKQ